MLKVKLITSGGLLCVDVPATTFTPPLMAGAKYDARVSGSAIEVTFGPQGARALVTFGLVASSTGATVSQTSRFGVNVDNEAKQLGWKGGRSVTMIVNAMVLVFE